MNKDPFPPIKDPMINSYYQTHISKKLKDYFTENGMKQNEIAETLDITQSAVSNQLNGRPFGINSAKKWSKAFGFSINWLTTGEGPMFEKKKLIRGYLSEGIYKKCLPFLLCLPF